MRPCAFEVQRWCRLAVAVRWSGDRYVNARSRSYPKGFSLCSHIQGSRHYGKWERVSLLSMSLRAFTAGCLSGFLVGCGVLWISAYCRGADAPCLGDFLL